MSYLLKMLFKIFFMSSVTTFLIISSYTSIHIGLEFLDKTVISQYFTFLKFV